MSEQTFYVHQPATGIHVGFVRYHSAEANAVNRKWSTPSAHAAIRVAALMNEVAADEGRWEIKDNDDTPWGETS